MEPVWCVCHSTDDLHMVYFYPDKPSWMPLLDQHKLNQNKRICNKHESSLVNRALSSHLLNSDKAPSTYLNIDFR